MSGVFEASAEAFSRVFSIGPLDDLARDLVAVPPERRDPELPFERARVRALRVLLVEPPLLERLREPLLLERLLAPPLLERLVEDRVVCVAILRPLSFWLPCRPLGPLSMVATRSRARKHRRKARARNMHERSRNR